MEQSTALPLINIYQRIKGKKRSLKIDIIRIVKFTSQPKGKKKKLRSRNHGSVNCTTLDQHISKGDDKKHIGIDIKEQKTSLPLPFISYRVKNKRTINEMVNM